MRRILCAAWFAGAAACGGLVSPDSSSPSTSNDASAPELDAASTDDATSVEEDASLFPPPDGFSDAACGVQLYQELQLCLNHFPSPPCDGGHVFTRLDDFLAFFRQLAENYALVDPAHHLDCALAGIDAGACDYDPRARRLGPSDVHYSNSSNEFVGPDGRQDIWVYIPAYNEYLLADSNGSPGTYSLVLEYVTCELPGSD
jgi:hypothetical protein